MDEKQNPFNNNNKNSFKKTNPFNQTLVNNAEEKEIPYTSKQTFPHEKYKTVRIKPDDFKLLREYAFINEMTMVDAISKALKLLTDK
ncbi:hypothetical protein ACIQXV_28300 [Neobacillus sp. NPDC097160]|uniref:hypothetical protein n=1 Tax=Neobacillus sp. NPDC097160 TaxID=3364298 RepID=UPI0037F3774F